MRKILLLLAHPALDRSRINRALFQAAQSVDAVTPQDLYELYPDFLVDADEQQALLREHDIVVFQHPFFWYSCPALLKEWQDLVLEYGFAYGEGGTALHGKALVSAISTGGGTDAYHAEGHNRFTMSELLRPFDQTAHLCGMRYLPPFLVHSAHQVTGTVLEGYAARYVGYLERLADPKTRLDHLAPQPHLPEAR